MPFTKQWSLPVKPPRSQNYVKPHDARTRVHVAKVMGARDEIPQRSGLRGRTRYRTVLRSSTVLSNTRLIVQIQRLPMNASGYRQ